MEETIFTRIIKGEIPSYKVAETEDFYAFLDISPLAKGHTLVIPKQQIDYFFDIEDDKMAEMMLFAKKVARAIKKTTDCIKVGVAVVGLEVPHAHVHLVPMKKVSDLNFANPKVSLTDEEFRQIAADIAAAME